MQVQKREPGNSPTLYLQKLLASCPTAAKVAAADVRESLQQSLAAVSKVRSLVLSMPLRMSRHGAIRGHILDS